MKTALVLSGGGARGAYEAGVISYLRDELEPRLGRPLRLDILCGTSVGALTACALASTADRPAQQGGELRRLWSQMALNEVLMLGVADFGRALLEMGGGGLINPVGLKALVLRHVSWPQIGRNLRSHQLAALCVTTTRVRDGKTCVFVQQETGASSPWANDPQLEVVPARIGPRHALASAAMPLLFAPVAIDQQLHLDGGLRLNVPLRPALRLGARRVIVITLQPPEPMAAQTHAPNPVTASFIAGKALNALMQERTERDVEHLRRLNAVIASGYGAFGRSFGSQIDAQLASRREKPLRYVRNLVIRPSVDVGILAAKMLRSSEFCRRHDLLPGALVELLATRRPEEAADLASYLLFDAPYTDELISLGRSDARASEAQWVRFFDDTPLNAAEADADAPRRVANG